MPPLISPAEISPEFAVEVARLLETDSVEEAIALGQAGVIAYPNYATGFLVLARAYLRSGNTGAAVAAAEQGKLLAPASPALQGLAAPTPAEPALDAELAALASALEHARMPQLDTSVPVPQTSIPTRSDILITPTLGSIYEKQGLLVEALATYKTLAAQEGGRKYQAKIAELESKLKTK